MGENIDNVSSDKLTLLFVCTHNRCRSILCEALTRHYARGRIAAFSAGSQPSGAVHPDTLTELKTRDIDVANLRSTSWDAHEHVAFDAVITVCDSAAGEPCPVWLGNSVKVHWGLTDPTKIEDSDARKIAFDEVITLIEQRIIALSDSNAMSMRGEELRDALQALAHHVP